MPKQRRKNGGEPPKTVSCKFSKKEQALLNKLFGIDQSDKSEADYYKATKWWKAELEIIQEDITDAIVQCAGKKQAKYREELMAVFNKIQQCIELHNMQKEVKNMASKKNPRSRKNASPFNVGIKWGGKSLTLGKIRDALQKQGYTVHPIGTSAIYTLKRKGNYFEAMHISKMGDTFDIVMARMSKDQKDRLPNSFQDFEYDDLATLSYPLPFSNPPYPTVSEFLKTLQIGRGFLKEISQTKRKNPRRRKNTNTPPSSTWEKLGVMMDGTKLWKTLERQSEYRFAWVLYQESNGRWSFSGGESRNYWDNDGKGYTYQQALQKIKQFDDADSFDFDRYNEDFNNNPRRRKNGTDMKYKITLTKTQHNALRNWFQGKPELSPMFILWDKAKKKTKSARTLTFMANERFIDVLVRELENSMRHTTRMNDRDWKALRSLRDQVKKLGMNDKPRRRKNAKSEAKRAMDMHHKEGIPLKDAWAIVKGEKKPKRKNGSKDDYILKLSPAQVAVLFDYHGGQTSMFYSVASQANSRKSGGQAKIRRQDMEAFEIELNKAILSAGRLDGSTSDLRSLQAIDNKVEKLLSSGKSKNPRKRKNGTKKGQVRKTARRAYMKNPDKYTRKRGSHGRMMYFKNGKICSKETYTKKL